MEKTEKEKSQKKLREQKKESFKACRAERTKEKHGRLFNYHHHHHSYYYENIAKKVPAVDGCTVIVFFSTADIVVVVVVVLIVVAAASVPDLHIVHGPRGGPDLVSVTCFRVGGIKSFQ